MVSRPNVLLALNEPSLRKFLSAAESDAWVLYNASALPQDCARPDVRIVALPFTQLADQLGNARAANMIMLGALLELTGMVPEESVAAVLRRLVRNEQWLEIDLRAIARGREECRHV
jgi:Pyruvate/2-oxoacid:ferredoxin oxidoreductase gamma subunit